MKNTIIINDKPFLVKSYTQNEYCYLESLEKDFQDIRIEFWRKTDIFSSKSELADETKDFVNSIDIEKLKDNIDVLIDCNNESKKISFDEIMIEVCKLKDIRLSVFRSRCKKREIVDCRFLFYAVSKKFTRKTLYEIGEFAGGYCHSTVLNGLKEVENIPSLNSDYKLICHILNNK